MKSTYFKYLTIGVIFMAAQAYCASDAMDDQLQRAEAMDQEHDIKCKVDFKSLLNTPVSKLQLEVMNTSTTKALHFQVCTNPLITFKLIIEDMQGNRVSAELPIRTPGTPLEFMEVTIKPLQTHIFEIPISHYLSREELRKIDASSYRWHLAVLVSRSPAKALHLNGSGLRLDKNKINKQMDAK